MNERVNNDELMTKTKIIVESSGGKIIALHSSDEVDFHLINWDLREEDGTTTWEKKCKIPYSSDRLVDKRFDLYMNEILSS
jgi:hypothetical protein